MAPYSSTNNVRLEGKCVAITGANTGLGKETAKELAGRGARVLLLSRNEEKTLAAAKEITEATGNSQVIFYKLELSSLKSVRKCAEEVTAKEEKIDILINNAGVCNCPQAKTEDGHDMQFGTNHLGHFLLTELLLPMLKKSAATGFHPRIVILSSMAHSWGEIRWDDLKFEEADSYGPWTAYAQSKLANVMHTKELARRLEGTGITVYAVHPGMIETEAGRHMEKRWWVPILGFFLWPFIKGVHDGIQTTIYCALEPKIENDSGKYYSNCKEETPCAKALDEDDQKRLWKISEELVGIKRQKK